jgi:hypothetical protein
MGGEYQFEIKGIRVGCRTRGMMRNKIMGVVERHLDKRLNKRSETTSQARG